MSLKQRQATQIKIMINGEGSVDPQRLEDYKNSGGALSKEEISQINDLEGVEPGAFTEVSDEEAKRQIEAEDNPFASILSPFVDKFKNFSEGIEKSPVGETLKDEKIPNMLKGIATGIGEKNPELPSQIKDTVIKSVTGMGKEKLVNPLMQMIESKAGDNPILQMIMNNSEVSQNTLAQQSADAAVQNNSTDRNPGPGVLVQPEPSVGASIEIKPTSPEIPFIKLMTGMTKKYSLTSTSNKSMLPPEIAARIQ